MNQVLRPHQIDGKPIKTLADFQNTSEPFGAYWMSNDKYHQSRADQDIIGASKLKDVLESLDHYLMPTSEETKAMRIGSATHAMITEPEEFDSIYRIAPEFKLNSSEGALKAANWIAGLTGSSTTGNEHLKIGELRSAYRAGLEDLSSQGISILRAEEHEKLKCMHKAIWSHPSAKHIFHDGWAELSFFGQFPNPDGTPGPFCSVRPDYLRRIKEDGEWRWYLISIKTARNSSKRAFAKDIYDRGYDLAEAFYVDFLREVFAIDIHAVWFVVVQNQAPHICEVYPLGPQSLESGQIRYQRGLSKIAAHRAGEIEYTGYTKAGNTEEIEMPDWAQL